MPTPSLIPVAKQQYLDANGNPLVGGQLFTYAAGTSVLKDTFTDAAGTVKQPNPIPLNSRGEPANPIFWSGAYRIELRDSGGNLIYTVDNYVDPFSVLSGTGGAALIGSASGTVEDRLNAAVTLTQITTGQVSSYASGTPLVGVNARFSSTEAITAHAHYGFLDNSTVQYAQAGFQAHASFNDNVKFTGSQNSDHHHSFQAYPHYGCTGTLSELSCFWSQPDVTAGAVTTLTQFRACNALGTGGIFTQYGLYVEALTRGNANYAIYVNGPTVSYFGGALVLGQIGNPAYIMYNSNSGNLDLIPRTGYGVNTDAPLLFGAASGAPAKIAYNTNGNLDITPRTGYHTTITAGSLLMGPALPAAGEKLNITGATSDYLVRLYNTDTNPKGLALVYTGASPNGTGNEFLYCQDSTAVRAKILSNGNMQNVNNSYGAISDINLKENVVDASDKLDDLMRVRIVNYNLIGDPDHKQLGVIAQELATVFPGMIEETVNYEDVEIEPARTITTTTQRQKTASREETHMVPTFVDGQWRSMPTPVKVDAPVFEDHPLFDANGQPVLEMVKPGKAAVVDEDGEVITPGIDPVYRQRVHQVPVMEDVKETIDVPAKFERRVTGSNTLSVKYSVFVPMLIKALQELKNDFDDYRSSHP